MSEFIQVHILTSYPPANLNRDDLNRPKTAVVGGQPRLRISSQCLKRTWRTSEVFRDAVEEENIGTRTRTMGSEIRERLVNGGMEEEAAEAAARAIAGEFGKLKKGSLEIEQLAHFGSREQEAVRVLCEQLVAEGRAPTEEETGGLLRTTPGGVDIALFGRMLADSPRYNVEAAVQVAHAITVHKVAVEDDYFTAVDDLNKGDEDLGAAHVGELGFGAGVFYSYLCVNRDLLVRNLGGDEELAGETLQGLLKAAATVAPSGKQNSFASRAYASYVLVERGERQPRSLAAAFLEPIRDADLLGGAIRKLEGTRDDMNLVYGKISRDTKTLNAVSPDGSHTLDELAEFVRERDPAAGESRT